MKTFMSVILALILAFGARASADTAPIVQTLHASDINCITINSDGRVLVSADTNGLVKVWDTTTGRLLRNFSAPFPVEGTFALSLSPSAKYLLAEFFQNVDNSINVTGTTIWNLHTGDSVVFSENWATNIGAAVDDNGNFETINWNNKQRRYHILSFKKARSYKHFPANSPIILPADLKSQLATLDMNDKDFVRRINSKKPEDQSFESEENDFNRRQLEAKSFIDKGRTACSAPNSNAPQLKVKLNGVTAAVTAGATLKVQSDAVLGRVIEGHKPGWIRLKIENGRLTSQHPDDSRRIWGVHSTLGQLSWSSSPQPKGGIAPGCFDEIASVAEMTIHAPLACAMTTIGPVGSHYFSAYTNKATSQKLLLAAISRSGSLSSAINNEASDGCFTVQGIETSTVACAGAVGSILLIGLGNGQLKAFDATSAHIIWQINAHTSQITSIVDLDSETPRFATASLDGSISVWDAKDINRAPPRLLVRLFAAPNGEWLAITKAGFFASTMKGSNYVNVVSGLQAFSVEQFFEHLARPDLVGELLKGDPEGKYTDEAAKLNLTSVLDSGPAPQIDHIQERDERAGDSIRLSVRVTGKGGGVGARFVWKVNGVTQGNTKPIEVATDASPLASSIITETLKLVLGQASIIEVTAYNRAGLLATPPFKIMVDKFGTSTTVRPRLFALTIGIDQYRMKDYRLNYAAHDANTFAKALGVVGSSLFSEVVVKTLTDLQANEAEIKAALQDISRVAKPDDVLVLFLGGHGKSIAGRYFYYPQSLDFAAGHTVETQGIGQDKWEAWLAKIAVQKSLLIIDTCEGDAFRGARGTDNARQTAMDQLQHATGRNVIAASRDAAYEGYQGHGVLTYALLEALNKTSDSTGDDRVRVTALADHIGRRVPEISQKNFGIYQNPTRKLSGNDFPIGIRSSILTAAEGTGPAIPKESTHVLIRAELLREQPAIDAPGSQTLTPGTQVRAVEFVGAWAVIARDGQKLGYVPVEAMARMH